MPLSFSESFWAHNYSDGLDILFKKLQQGCVENMEILSTATIRADAEEVYGNKLLELGNNYCAPRQNGFGRDEGASLKKAYDGMTKAMIDEGRAHVKISDNIRTMVITPFTAWSSDHENRINKSETTLKSKLKEYNKSLKEVKSLHKTYFNKCRILEDQQEEIALAFPVQSPNLSAQKSDLNTKSFRNSFASFDLKNPFNLNKDLMSNTSKDDDLETTDDDTESIVELGDLTLTKEKFKESLSNILSNIPLKEVRVPILGVYSNISTGEQIVNALQVYFDLSTIGECEQIGQALINEGYLRLIGSVGSTFANSSVLNYQWKPKAFNMIGDSANSNEKFAPTVGGYFGGLVNSMNNTHLDETPIQKMQREVNEADKRYKQGIKRLDDIRCKLEESIFDHLNYLEKCETHRLSAIKAVVLDFGAAISNVIPSLQSTIDQLLLYQETINPANDLRYMIESCRTGSFLPRVTAYDNYYSTAEEQTFGVDLELRARGDNKKVPMIISLILSHMDDMYPILGSDDARRQVWLANVSLKDIHELRSLLNTGKNFSKEVLKAYPVPVVAAVLKLYFLELPDSLISSTLYDIIKSIYLKHGSDADSRIRLSTIQTTLSQLRLCNVATLDAIMTHFTRLMSLTSSDESYKLALAQEFSKILLRPRVESPISLEDRHGYRLLCDIFDNKEKIFQELKRTSTGGSIRNRRTVSTDESNRRAMVEARHRALTAVSQYPDKDTPVNSPANGNTKVKSSPHSPNRNLSVYHSQTSIPLSLSPNNPDNNRSSPIASRLESSNNRSPNTGQRSSGLNWRNSFVAPSSPSTKGSRPNSIDSSTSDNSYSKDSSFAFSGTKTSSDSASIIEVSDDRATNSASSTGYKSFSNDTIKGVPLTAEPSLATIPSSPPKGPKVSRISNIFEKESQNLNNGSHGRTRSLISN